jgi:hypothetical protein
MAIIPCIICAGGCTCTISDLIVQGPNPSTSLRSRTAIVKSWCQATFQFELRVLLKKIPRTAKHFGPKTLSMISRTDLDIASSKTRGRDRRFLWGAVVLPNCLQKFSRVASSRHTGTMAKPSRSTRALVAMAVLASLKFTFASDAATPSGSSARRPRRASAPHRQEPSR